MSNLGDLPELTESTNDDYFLVRQNGRDVKAKKLVLMNTLYPVGSVLLFHTYHNPSEMGYAGVWDLVGEEDSVIATSSTSSSDLGSCTGSNYVETPLPSHTHTGTISEGGAHNHLYFSSPVNPEVSPLLDYYDNALIDTGHVVTNAVTEEAGIHHHMVGIGGTGTTDTLRFVKQRSIKVLLWLRTS